MDTESIDTVGKWLLRLGLLVGAVSAGLYGNDDVAGACVFGLVMSFLLL